MQYTWIELMETAMRLSSCECDRDCLKTDCDIIIFLLENCIITLPEDHRFFVTVNCDGIMTEIIAKRAEKFHTELKDSMFWDGIDAYSFTGLYDFSHTSACWEDVISLGIAGIRNRLREYANKYAEDDDKQYFYRNAIRVFDAALKFMKRAEITARSLGRLEMAEGILHLTKDAPCNLYEAMQTTIIYYILQQMFDASNLRTLGRVDSLYRHFYEHEKDSEYVRKLAEDFIREIDLFNVNANIPFAIGGTDNDGMTMYNDMSRILLKAYSNVPSSNTKLHFLYNDNTPKDMLEAAFECVRRGMNSICFLSDKKVEESLIKLGEDPEDAAAYTVVGCYECGGREEITCSCNARVNIVKAVEYAMNGGMDFLSGKQIGLVCDSKFANFGEFAAEVERQLVHLSKCAMEITDFYESKYSQLHSAPILSATYPTTVKKGKDIYCGQGAKYNNSSVNGLGLATATDAMLAIKKLVFEEKKLTLEQFAEILKNNWKDQEVLRLTIRNKYPKYGMGNKEADKIASRIVQVLSDSINKRPNVKGGIYRLGMFSIDWRVEFGKHTGASADGRYAEEALSQNTGASFGADREGATAHILSVTELDAGNTPNGSILDLDLHSTAVQGRSGMNMMISTLKTYFERGGFAIHYNVLNAQVLRDAKINPEKYPNLQVRLCGWNVLFSSLSEQAQEEFIARAGNVG